MVFPEAILTAEVSHVKPTLMLPGIRSALEHNIALLKGAAALAVCSPLQGENPPDDLVSMKLARGSLDNF